MKHGRQALKQLSWRPVVFSGWIGTDGTIKSI